MGRVGPERRDEVIDISVASDIFPIENSNNRSSRRMDPRDVERPSLSPKKWIDRSSGSTSPVSQIGCTNDMSDTRRDRAVSTSSTASRS
jgi:hypothetical protein